MKVVLVTGGRDYDDWSTVDRTLTGESPDMVVHGCALGADGMAAQWAHRHVLPQVRFPARWQKHGKQAGPMRNAAMVAFAAQLADLSHEVRVVAFPGGRGTADCVSRAHAVGLDVREIT